LHAENLSAKINSYSSKLLFSPRDATHSAVLLQQVVCSSVRLSVTLRYRDHIGWNSSKIISRLLSLGCSLSTDPKHHGSTARGTPRNIGQNRGWCHCCVEKAAFGVQKL